MRERNYGGLCWEVSDEFEPLLASVWDSKGEIVKQSSIKQVTRREVGGRVYYVKRDLYEKRAFWPMKFFFKASRSGDEWRLAPRLEALGMAIVPHLAYGERWGWNGLQESVLITEGIGDDRLLKQIENADAEELQRAVGKFLRQLHAAGAHHRDLNLRNLLYSPTERRVRMVDLDKIEILSSVNREQRLEVLVFLARFFPLTAAFFEAYGDGFAAYAGEIARRAAVKRRLLFAQRSRRCWEQNFDFAAMELGRLRWQVRQPHAGEELQRILQDPDGYLSSHARILKSGRSATVGCGDGFVLKRFNFRKLGRGIRDLVRASRAFRAFRKAYHLELAGVPTARPIAAADRRVLRWLSRCYFVMEEIHGATELAKWNGDRRLAAERAAWLLAKMHEEGFSHRDLKETNIVFNAEGEPFLLDLDGLKFFKQLPPRRAAADLERLARGIAKCANVTFWDRVSFLRCYCKVRRLAHLPRL